MHIVYHLVSSFRYTIYLRQSSPFCQAAMLKCAPTSIFPFQILGVNRVQMARGLRIKNWKHVERKILQSQSFNNYPHMQQINLSPRKLVTCCGYYFNLLQKKKQGIFLTTFGIWQGWNEFSQQNRQHPTVASSIAVSNSASSRTVASNPGPKATFTPKK